MRDNHQRLFKTNQIMNHYHPGARASDREVLGLSVGDSEDGAFWTGFLRSLRARGLGGVRLVISDAHEGLRGAIARVFTGAAWQRCRCHGQPHPSAAASRRQRRPGPQRRCLGQGGRRLI